MKKESIKRLRLVYGILLGAAAVAAGICLIAACLTVYRSGGDQIFTPEKVAEAFVPISGVVYLFLALTVGGFLLDFSLPAESKKRKAEKNPAGTLSRLLSKRDLSTCDPTLKQQILAQQTLRKRDLLIGLALLALCSVLFLTYGLNSNHYHQSEINASMVKAVLLLLGSLVLPFGYGVFAAYRARASLNREIELVKQIPAGEKTPEVPVKNAANVLRITQVILVCAALGLLVYGFFAGGTADVLTKAVNICTECVGLG